MFIHGVIQLQITLSLSLQGKNKDLCRENNPHVNCMHICKFKIPSTVQFVCGVFVGFVFCFGFFCVCLFAFLWFFYSIFTFAAILMPMHTSFGEWCSICRTLSVRLLYVFLLCQEDCSITASFLSRCPSAVLQSAGCYEFSCALLRLRTAWFSQ